MQVNDHPEGPEVPKQTDETEKCIVQKQEDSVRNQDELAVEEKMRSCEEVETKVLDDLASINTLIFPVHRLMIAKTITSKHINKLKDINAGDGMEQIKTLWKKKKRLWTKF